MPKLTLRYDDDLHARVEALAKRDRRSINSELEWLIEQAVEVQEQPKETK
jgi:predicted HicB family RNase H-like nuclease